MARARRKRRWVREQNEAMRLVGGILSGETSFKELQDFAESMEKPTGTSEIRLEYMDGSSETIEVPKYEGDAD